MKKRIIAIVAIIALVAILGIVFVACNADSYASKLEKKGYEVKIQEGSSNSLYPTEWSVVAANPETGDFVTITKFADSADAEFVELMGASFAGQGAEEIYRSGKIVIVGTEQGVKDAK